MRSLKEKYLSMHACVLNCLDMARLNARIFAGGSCLFLGFFGVCAWRGTIGLSYAALLLMAFCLYMLERAEKSLITYVNEEAKIRQLLYLSDEYDEEKDEQRREEISRDMLKLMRTLFEIRRGDE